MEVRFADYASAAFLDDVAQIGGKRKHEAVCAVVISEAHSAKVSEVASLAGEFVIFLESFAIHVRWRPASWLGEHQEFLPDGVEV